MISTPSIQDESVLETSTIPKDGIAVDDCSSNVKGDGGDVQDQPAPSEDDPSSPDLQERVTKVAFANIHIRQYPMVPGNNPSVIKGCPVELSWEYDFWGSFTVEEYEASRPSPRSMVELRMPAAIRESMLKRVGFSRNDILAGAKEATIVRNRRKRTEEMSHLAPVQEFLERAKRGTMNMTVKRGAKKKEKELIKSFKNIGEKEIGVLKRSESPARSVDTDPLDDSTCSKL